MHPPTPLKWILPDILGNPAYSIFIRTLALYHKTQINACIFSRKAHPAQCMPKFMNNGNELERNPA